MGWGGYPLGGKATTMAIGNPETHPAIEACHGERFHRTKDATMDPQIVLHCGGSKCQWQGNGKVQQSCGSFFGGLIFKTQRSSIVGFAKLLLQVIFVISVEYPPVLGVVCFL